MADGSENKLALNMDKIAYGAAGLFGIAALALAFTCGGELVNLRKEIANAKQDIDGMRGRDLPEREIPQIERALKKQWPDTVKVKTATPEWSHERIPAFVLFEEGPGTSYAQHPEPVIKEVQCLRSGKSFRVGVRVIAELPERTNADLVDLKLLRKDDEGDFAELKRFGAKTDLSTVAETGAVSFIDTRVRAGKVYTYKLISFADRSADAEDHIEMQEEDKEKESSECSISSPIPFDYWVTIVTARPYDPTTGENAHFIGSIKLGSSEPGADPISVSPPSGSSFEQGFSFGPKIARGKPLFEISTIGENNEVVVRNRNTKKSRTFKPGRKSPSLVLSEPADCAMSGGGSSGEGEDGAEEEAEGDDDDSEKDGKKDSGSKEEPDPTPKKTPKKKKKSGGFR